MTRSSLLLFCLAATLFGSCAGNTDQPIHRPDTPAGPPAQTPPPAPSPTPVDTQAAGQPDTDRREQEPSQPAESGRITQRGPAPQEKGDRAPVQFQGMIGTVEKETAPSAATATLVTVRTAQHEYFDRIVFEFDGETVPGYRLEYIDKPVRACGSGEVVPIEGQGWLELRIRPARAHDDSGRPTVVRREYKFAYPVFREVERTCDFEGTLTYVIGTASPHKFRLVELENPPRIALDISH